MFQGFCACLWAQICPPDMPTVLVPLHCFSCSHWCTHGLLVDPKLLC
jgi:hypothetical protein